MAGFAKLIWLDVECADPNALAEFYGQVLGWDVTHYRDTAAPVTYHRRLIPVMGYVLAASGPRPIRPADGRHGRPAH